MRIYLDTSVYNRPFDDHSQPRIWLEALAFISILHMIETGEIDLVSSWTLKYENSQNPFLHRKKWIEHYISLAKHTQKITLSIKERAKKLEKQGLDSIDVLHLASAEAAGVDYFLTCDDRILKCYKGVRLKVANPVDFIIKGGQNG